jgi:hypothetical protein
MDELRIATRIIAEFGGTVNKTCGLHVHHEAADLTVEQIKRVARGWKNNASIIDGLVSQSRRAATCSYYCKPLTAGDISQIDGCTNLDQVRRLRLDRYRTMNLMSYGRFGTIEIRQHQGTINYEKIRTWVLMGQALMDTAIAATQIPASSTVRDFITSLGARLDETARTYLIGRAVEFGHAAL